MSIELIRGELERLFSLEEMLKLSSELLGFEPTLVGGTASTASFARALTQHCEENDAVAALIDAVTGTKPKASRKLTAFVDAVVRGPIELKKGATLGGFTIARKMGSGPNGTVYRAKRDDKDLIVKVLHASAVHDRSSLYRYLTRNRMVGAVDHDSLAAGVEAGFVEGRAYVAYPAFDAKPLAPRIARTGALHINEARTLLHGLLQGLKAIHERKLVHGALKLENVLVGKNEDGSPKVVLVDAGGDLLSSSWVHSDVATGGGDRIKGIAPEMLKGLGTTAASDMYGFGALLFEMLTGKPPLEAKTATDLAVAHLSEKPAEAAKVAPRGWVSDDLSKLVGKLLDKNAKKRPSIDEVLKFLGPIEKAKEDITEEDLNDCIDALVADPTDTESAIALELTLDRGAAPTTVAEAFLMAADQVDPAEAEASARKGEKSKAVAEAKAEAARDRARDIKKSLLFRAARLFDKQLKNHARAEETYKWILEVDEDDEVAQNGHEEALQAQDKIEDLIELLLERGQEAESHSVRARSLNKIGHIYATVLDDPEQACFAFAQALAQDVQNDEFAADLERAAGKEMTYWADAMRTLHEVTEHPRMPPEVKVSLFLRLGHWYVEKIARPDLALPCFETVLKFDPAHLKALDGMTAVYRRAQQWNELVAVLLSRVERAPTPEHARDLRVEAAEILETRLSDAGRARDLYEETLKEDAGHQKTVDALARIYQRDGDHAGYVKILDKQAEALTGRLRAEVLCKIGEIYEAELNDMPEAERRYDGAVEIDAGSLTALRGLDRIYSRTGRYEELLANLDKQVALAATPRRKINLFERIAGIHDEEFLDHGKAADFLEKVLELDGAHEGAMTALMRHYRALDRWDEVIELYDRNLRVVEDEKRRADLLMAQGRVLLEQIGSPERARLAYEHVLRMDPDHGGALESLAHVRAATGDAMAALSAVESLAEKADKAESKADLWVRAAKILEEHGDRDGAIARYKLALDAHAANVAASAGLRAAYLARGDAASAIELISQEIDRTEGKLAKARLYTELAELSRAKLGDNEAARKAAVKASDLDPTNIGALIVLGDIAFEAESFNEAATHFASVATRVEALDKAVGKKVLERYIDALARSGSTKKAVNIADALVGLAPDDHEAVRRAAKVKLDAEDGEGAVTLYEDIKKRFFKDMPEEDKGRVLVYYGRALRISGRPDDAVAPLKKAADLIPSSVEPINELCRVLEAQKKWDEVVRIKQQRLDLAEGEARAMILLELGEIYASHLGDSNKAAKNFVAALEEQPENRKVLTRLMKLYSEEKDWGKLVDVVLKLAEGVAEPLQKAKYIHTAAVVCWRQMGDLDRAIGYLDKVRELDAKNVTALRESIDIHEEKANWPAFQELLAIDTEKAEKDDDKKRLLENLERLANVKEQKLGEVKEAVEVLERLQKLDPDNTERAERLAGLYANNTELFLDKAVEAQRSLIRKNPFNAQPYRALRKLYTEAKQADPAWCICQALHCMSFAEPDEERFFRRMRADTAAEARERITADEWAGTITHDLLDPLVTAVFRAIEPAVLQKNTESLETLGFNPAYALDLSMHPYPMSQTLFYAAGVLGMEAPMTFQNPQDPGGISFLHSNPPCVVLGSAALAAELPTQAGAFIAARQLAYFQPGLYIRHLVPSGTGLRAWLFAAIRLIHSSFPVKKELESTVEENLEAIRKVVTGPEREKLTSVVTKLLQSGSIDLKRWVAAVDLTADRSGFILCHDLEVATEMIKAAAEGSAGVSQRERIRELTLFSVDSRYFALRQRLGISIDS